MQIIFFIGMLIISYFLFRSFGSKRNKLDLFHFRMRDKSNEKHLIDILELLFYGVTIYKTIFYENILMFDSYYIITFFISLISFGILLKIPGVGETVPNISKWNSNKILITILFILLSFYLNKGNNIFSSQNILFFKLLAVYLSIILVISYKKDKFKTFHPHHWQIFWFLSLLIKPINLKTKILSAIFLSMFSHGIICYSASSIISD